MSSASRLFAGVKASGKERSAQGRKHIEADQRDAGLGIGEIRTAGKRNLGEKAAEGRYPIVRYARADHAWRGFRSLTDRFLCHFKVLPIWGRLFRLRCADVKQMAGIEADGGVVQNEECMDCRSCAGEHDHALRRPGQ